MAREIINENDVEKVVGGSIVFTPDHTTCGLNRNNQCKVNDYDACIQFISANYKTMTEAEMMRSMVLSVKERRTMKSKYIFEKMELDGEIVAVPVGESAAELHAVLNVNEEAMRIIELLREETTEENIVAQLLKEYEGEKEEIAAYVHKYIEQLTEEGLLE